MQKLLDAYQDLIKHLTARGIIKDMPIDERNYGVRYNRNESADVWKLYIDAADMTLVAHLNDNGDVVTYMPFKQDSLKGFLKCDTPERKVAYGLYCDRVHPIIEILLERKVRNAKYK